MPCFTQRGYTLYPANKTRSVRQTSRVGRHCPLTSSSSCLCASPGNGLSTSTMNLIRSRSITSAVGALFPLSCLSLVRPSASLWGDAISFSAPLILKCAELRVFARISSRWLYRRMYSCAVRGAPSKFSSSHGSHLPCLHLLFASVSSSPARMPCSAVFFSEPTNARCSAFICSARLSSIAVLCFSISLISSPPSLSSCPPLQQPSASYPGLRVLVLA